MILDDDDTKTDETVDTGDDTGTKSDDSEEPKVEEEEV